MMVRLQSSSSLASQRRFPSPLRYPGGKGKLANYLKTVFIENGLIGASYIEPYAGGASVALALLYEEYVQDIQINDVNRGIFAFWSIATTQPERLCVRISRATLSYETWRRQKAVQAAAAPDPFDLAFSTFFLSRTNRSGIIINGGVIGGKAQKGVWKLDARFNKAELIRRIEKLGRYSGRITVTQRDALDLVREMRTKSARTVLYLDPPYFVNGHRLYQHYYTLADHEKIAAAVHGLSCSWIVSYDAVPDAYRLYEDCDSITYGLNYSASAIYEGTEAMFFSANLVMPERLNPSTTKAQEVDRMLRSYTK